MRADSRPESEFAVRRVVESEAEALSKLRLRALTTDPLSFASTYEKESQYDREGWSAWARRGATSSEMAILIAQRSDGRLVGMVGALAEENVLHLYGMWVDPDHRRAGLGARLLDAILAWAETSHPSLEIRLGVVPLTGSAMRLYQRRGFVDTGKVEPLPHAPEVVWHEMVRSSKRADPPVDGPGAGV